eukprot:XP_766436.1 hypothetical protein [Theileria parva strain Muguga]
MICKFNFYKWVNLNFRSFHCDRESPDSYPYQEALMKCVEETDCVSVRVDEFDVYNESFGLSKLCYSSNLTDLYPLLNGRVSVKANRRECKRLSCDFFTLKFLKPRTPNTEFDK